MIDKRWHDRARELGYAAVSETMSFDEARDACVRVYETDPDAQIRICINKDDPVQCCVVREVNDG